jgi:hypothetical protein
MRIIGESYLRTLRERATEDANRPRSCVRVTNTLPDSLASEKKRPSRSPSSHTGAFALSLQTWLDSLAAGTGAAWQGHVVMVSTRRASAPQSNKVRRPSAPHISPTRRRLRGLTQDQRSRSCFATPQRVRPSSDHKTSQTATLFGPRASRSNPPLSRPAPTTRHCASRAGHSLYTMALTV